MATTPDTRHLITIQAFVDAGSPTLAENIAVRVANYLEESNEDPDAEPTTIQTCIVQKAPFTYGPIFAAGQSCEEEIERGE